MMSRHVRALTYARFPCAAVFGWLPAVRGGNLRQTISKPRRKVRHSADSGYKLHVALAVGAELYRRRADDFGGIAGVGGSVGGGAWHLIVLHLFRPYRRSFPAALTNNILLVKKIMFPCVGAVWVIVKTRHNAARKTRRLAPGVTMAVFCSHIQ